MEVSLKDIGTIITGNTPSKKDKKYWDSKDICFVKPDIIGDDIDSITNSNEYISNFASSKARIVKRNTILITCIGNIGRIGIVSKEKIAFNQQINAIIPNSKINLRYLAYVLLFSRPRLKALANAAVVPIVNKTQLESFKIEIDPELEHQDKIANTLDEIEKIKKIQNKEIEYLDTLIKARFVEMFGDLKFDTPVSKYIESLTAGKSLAGKEKCTNKVLNTGAVSYDKFKNDYKYLPSNYVPDENNKVRTGNVLISRMNTQELVGATAYVWEAPENTYLPDRLWRANLKENVNSIFLWQVLIHPLLKLQIQRVSSGTSGSMKNISKSNFLKLKVPDVNEESQNKFASFVQQVDKSKVAIQKSLDETQILYDSLMQKYFS
ncbi:restriction endonuclease subunit S [Lactobacillus gallinarum]|uniref:restriction endonuclease subunit S n=1 Tax=Lactobacillus gallinarum TaxID=52242 RepID=UPI0024B9B35C|nr:restriction endonuclease subunit S [Lactobacillus gallinarum]